MRLILIRHGQTEWNAIGRWQGQADPPLNELGRTQAQQTALDLQSQPIDRLFSSDLLRATETAEIIARQFNLDVINEPRLREVNLGEWQGRLSEEIRARWPEQLKTWIESPLATRPPNGESIAEIAARVLSAIEDITTANTAQYPGIVAHELPLAIISCHAAGLPLDRLREQMLPNAGWRVIDWPRAKE